MGIVAFQTSCVLVPIIKVTKTLSQHKFSLPHHSIVSSRFHLNGIMHD